MVYLFYGTKYLVIGTLTFAVRCLRTEVNLSVCFYMIPLKMNLRTSLEFSPDILPSKRDDDDSSKKKRCKKRRSQQSQDISHRNPVINNI